MSNNSSGASALAPVPHDKTVWLFGDYSHEMAGVVQDSGYRTGNVQLFQRSALARSHAKREIKRIDLEKPDLLFVNLFVNRVDSKQIAKAVQFLTVIMERQLAGGRQLLIYGHDVTGAWMDSHLAPLLQDSRMLETRFRWCNLVGPMMTGGPGFRSVVKVFSDIRLWDGPPGADQICDHPRGDHASYEDHLAGPGNYKPRLQIWQGITYYLMVLVNSGGPLRPQTRPWGARPELQWRELQRKTMSSKGSSGGLPPALPEFPSNPPVALSSSKRKKKEAE